MAWDYFKTGVTILDAHVKIIDIEEPGIGSRDTIYLVRYLCCGRQRQISHHAIRCREGKGRAARLEGKRVPECLSCGKSHRFGSKLERKSKTNPILPDGIIPPVWDAPETVKRLYRQLQYSGRI